MKILKLIIPLLLAILLVGCLEQIDGTVPIATQESSVLLSGTRAIATPSQSNLPQETLTPTSSQSALPTLAATITNTPAQNTPNLSAANLLENCIEINNQDLEKIYSRGSLILMNRRVSNGRYVGNDYLLDMDTKEFVPLTDKTHSGLDYKVTPNRSLFAHHSIYWDAKGNIDGNIIRDELEILDTTGQYLNSIAWGDVWYRPVDWLDDQRLVINISLLDSDERHSRKAATLLVLNPFTGSRQVLSADYPHIYNYRPVPNWGDWGLTVYDPSLTRVVYLKINEKGEYVYALWDIEKEVILAELIYTGEYPRWSPDGSGFVVESIREGYDYKPGTKNPYELFLVSRDGDVNQLTNLNPAMDLALNGPSWSPDGRYIAVWLEPRRVGNEMPAHEPSLGIVDARSGMVTDYCIQGKYGGEGYGGGYVDPPIWSPDGTQLVATDWYEGDHRRVILVDLVEEYATVIAEDMQPAGWMQAP